MADRFDRHDGNHRFEIIGEQRLHVGRNRTETVDNDETLRVGHRLLVEVGDEIVFTVGAASLTMKKDGTVVIKGRDITIEGSGAISVKASGNLVMKGSKILQN